MRNDIVQHCIHFRKESTGSLRKHLHKQWDYCFLSDNKAHYPQQEHSPEGHGPSALLQKPQYILWSVSHLADVLVLSWWATFIRETWHKKENLRTNIFSGHKIVLQNRAEANSVDPTSGRAKLIHAPPPMRQALVISSGEGLLATHQEGIGWNVCTLPPWKVWFSIVYSVACASASASLRPALLLSQIFLGRKWKLFLQQWLLQVSHWQHPEICWVITARREEGLGMGLISPIIQCTAPVPQNTAKNYGVQNVSGAVVGRLCLENNSHHYLWRCFLRFSVDFFLKFEVVLNSIVS